MRVMVTGSTGQLGYDTSAYLRAQGAAILAADRKELDLTDAESVKAYVDAYRPDAVIHCAAYTAVDAAETERTACELVNASATRTLAEICGKLGIKLVYISTDYVFDGSGTEPHETDETPAPLNVYGRTKLAGEEAVRELCPKHFIVRTSWVFGAHGNSFVKTILRLAETKDEIKVVDDQIGSPTYTKDLAPLLGKMIKTCKYGTYHATNEGFCSWADLAIETFRQAGVKVEVERVTSDKFPTKATRPHNSRLSKEALDQAGFARLPRWQDAVGRYLIELHNH